MGEVDLTRLAMAYGFRADDGLSRRIAIMLERSRVHGGSIVVDVGGGRGAQSEACRTTGATVIVADPAMPMVQYAVQRGAGIFGVLARGESLPFPDASVDLVFFHLSIHHGDWKVMLDEAYRIIGPRGQVWVWSTTDAHHRASFLARWFPSVGEIDEHRFPKIGALEEHLAALGDPGETVGHRDVVHRPASEWVAAVRAGFVSTLHLVESAEIEAGLAAFQSAYPDPDTDVEYELEYAGVWCIRPPLQS